MRLLFVSLLILSSCTNLDFGQQVTYRVNGGMMFIEYSLPGDSKQSITRYTNWTTECIAHSGDEVYIKAINNGSPGGMSVTIYRDGIEWIQQSSMEPYDTITITDKIPFRF